MVSNQIVTLSTHCSQMVKEEQGSDGSGVGAGYNQIYFYVFI